MSWADFETCAAPPPPRPHLLPPPAPRRGDPVGDAASRWYARYDAATVDTEDLAAWGYEQAQDARDDADDIAALTARVGALSALCGGLGAGLVVLVLILAVRMLGGM